MKINKVIIILVLVILIAASYIYYLESKLDKTEEEMDKLSNAFDLYYHLLTNTDRVGRDKTVGVFYKGVTCINLKNLRYYQALEVFNHEWQHYKNSNHFQN